MATKAKKKTKAAKTSKMTNELYHEMGHTAYLALDFVGTHLLECELYTDKQIKKEVEKAFDSLFKVYQASFGKITVPKAKATKKAAKKATKKPAKKKAAKKKPAKKKAKK